MNEPVGGFNANQVLAAAPADAILSFPEGKATVDVEVLASFAAQPRLALVVVADPSLGQRPAAATGRTASLRSRDRLARLRALLRDGLDAGKRPTVVLRASAAIAVGGFDPSFPGFGWPDLIQRLRTDGWDVPQMPSGELLANAEVGPLTSGLSTRDRLRTEARWRLRHDPSGFERFRRLVLATAKTLPGQQIAKAVGTDARQRWQGAAPHTAQEAVGFRADWRFLLPDGRRDLTVIVAGPDCDEERWTWLADDGWTGRVSFEASPDQPADVVFVDASAFATERSSADEDPVDQAINAAGSGATLVICQNRSANPAALEGRLAEAGFASVLRYAITPGLDRPRRFTPLAHGPSVAWLFDDALSSIGPLARGREAVPGLAAASRLAGEPLRRALPALLPSLAIARRSSGPNALAPAAIAHRLIDASVGVTLLTSGHDEGSRAILIPTGADGAVEDVTKISARPGYNQNLTGEVARIASLRRLLDPADQDLLPSVSDPVPFGPLVASWESFAGRQTASDRCFRFPAEREPILGQVLDAIDRFSTAAAWGTVPWSAELFDRSVSDLYRRYSEAVGASASLEALLALLRERSDSLTGLAFPLARRHYDLGPWNVMWRPDGVALVDWELAPPRSAEDRGLGGADQLYFVKYWLHIALGTDSVDDECAAFPFLGGDPCRVAAEHLTRSLCSVGVDRRFVPIIATHTWLESALYTIERRGGAPGTAKDYLETLARYRHPFVEFWSEPSTETTIKGGRDIA